MGNRSKGRRKVQHYKDPKTKQPKSRMQYGGGAHGGPSRYEAVKYPNTDHLHLHPRHKRPAQPIKKMELGFVKSTHNKTKGRN